MNNFGKVKTIGLLVTIVLLLTISFYSKSFAIQMVTSSLLFTQAEHTSTLFNDEFNGTELDQTKWGVFRGSPVIDGWLTLPASEIQSKAMFSCGAMEGVIQSSDWKPQNQFTDTSFGFEIWGGANGQCHSGILFKGSGHLATLHSQPDANNNCTGDPLYQDYQTISNWDTIRAGGAVSFTLSWRSDVITLTVNGNYQEEQASYTGPAIPNVPLKIRLYTQLGETYKIDYIHLYGCHFTYLPIIMRPLPTSTPTITPTPSPTLTPTPTPTPTPTSKTIIINANSYPFQSTEITISSGDRLEFSASGNWNCGLGTIGPNGNDRKEPNSPAPNGNYCGLVGVIGTGTPSIGGGFFIGSAYQFTASQGGMLYLGSNENLGKCDGSHTGSCYEDNTGSISVHITKR
jgi:hypothetical protein